VSDCPTVIDVANARQRNVIFSDELVPSTGILLQLIIIIIIIVILLIIWVTRRTHLQ